MRVNTKIILDIESGAVISRESYEYEGPTAQAVSFGKTSNKSQQQAQSKNESGTEFNEDFLNKAFAYASLAKPGKYKLNAGGTAAAAQATQGPFDAARYLRENPDVAASRDHAANPYAHYLNYGKAEGRAYPGDTSTGVPSFAGGEGGDLEFEIPGYDPNYVRPSFTGSDYTSGTFTGANYTPVEGGDFSKLEQNIYAGNQAKLRQAYEDQVGMQREELSQSGALNSPSQFLEGSARSALDKGYLANLQQAARDASSMVLGLKAQEAARKTGFDVGEAVRRTGFDVGEAGARTGFGERQAGRRTEFDTSEAGRETGFNQEVQARLLQLWLQKIGIIGEVGRYARGESISSGISSGGGFNFGYTRAGGTGTIE